MDQNNHEDEISLKELILTLINEWKIIAIITVFATLIFSAYALFIADEKYESSVTGTISLTEKVPTKFGEYTLPSNHKMDYLNLALSDEVLNRVIADLGLKTTTNALKSSISVDNALEESRFQFKVIANSSELAAQIMTSLSANFQDYLTGTHKLHAIEFFLREYNVYLKSDETLIEKQEKTVSELKSQLELIPSVITLKKLVTSDPELAAKLASERGVSISELSDEMMYEEMSNPSYELLEASLITAETSLINTKINYDQNKILYDELTLEKNLTEKYFETGEDTALENGSLDFIRSKVSLSSYVSTSEQPVSPNKPLIITIGFVLGLMLGVFVALFKAYWTRT